MTIGGAGTLTLNVANTYSGTTTLDAGTLTLGIGTATSDPIGSSTLAASLAASSRRPARHHGGQYDFAELQQRVTIAGAAEPDVLRHGQQSATLCCRPICSSSSDSTNNVFGSTLTVTNTALTTFSGAINGSGSLILAGSGNTLLSGGSSSFSGGVFLTAGNLSSRLAATRTGSPGRGYTSGPLGTGIITSVRRQHPACRQQLGQHCAK